MLAAVLIANVLVIPILFIAGSLSDRYGRRRLFMAGVVLTGIWSFAVFPIIETRSFAWITTALLIGACFNSLTYGPMAAMFAELFSTRVRCSAVSLAYQLGAIVGGGATNEEGFLLQRLMRDGLGSGQGRRQGRRL